MATTLMGEELSHDLLPPGTVHLLALDDERNNEAEIVLVPTPSNDPNDPLNWSRNRKLLQISLVYAYTFTTGVGGTSTYSVLTEISDDTGITMAQLVLGTGFIFLLAGWGNVFWQPLALSYGRRPVFLLSLLGCLAISEWTAWIDSFPQWAAARVLFGFFVAPVEVLPEISIPDIFFAHERGSYVGGYGLFLNASNYIAPLIAGFMNDSIGWRWVQHWCALLLALNFVFAFFLQEETLYSRAGVEGEAVDAAPGSFTHVNAIHTTHHSEKIGDKTASEKSSQGVIPSSQQVGEVYEVKTYWQKLALWTRSGLSVKQVVTVAYRPIIIFFMFPNVMFAAFMTGFATVWYGVYNGTASSILSAEPYNLTSSQVGLTYLGPLFGCIIGAYIGGPFADWFTMKLARRNGGLREPEQRLWVLSIYCVALPSGLLLWGVGAYHKAHIAVLMLGSIVLGLGTIGGCIAISYNTDCFKEIAGESMVSLILCRNTLTFGINYAITPWIDASGLQNTFIASAVLSLVTGMTWILMIWKGKELRARAAERYWRYAATQLVKH